MLKSIELANLCQFEFRRERFGPGVTVVCGPQGSGKTNFFVLGLSGLTGENELVGAKALNLAHGTAGPAYARTEWERFGHSVDLLRGYRKIKSQLFIDGENKSAVGDSTNRKGGERGEGDITAAALQALGVFKGHVFPYSYVSQKCTSEVLNYKETARVEFFSKLLGCDGMMAWSTELNRAIASLQGQISHSYKTKLNELTVQKNKNATSKANNLVSAWRVSRELTAVVQELDGYKEAIQSSEKRRILEDKIVEKQAEIDKLTSQVATNVAEQLEKSKRLAEKTQQRDKYNSSAVALETNAHITRYEALLKSNDSEIASTKKLLEPVKAFDAELYKGVYAELNAATQRKASLRAQEAIAALGPTCPTCHQAVQSGVDVSAIRQQIKEVTALIDKLDTQKDQLSQIKLLYENWQRAKPAREASLAQLDQRKSEYSTYLASNVRVEVDQSISKLNVAQLNSEIASVTQSIGSLTESIRRDRESIAKTQKEFEDLSVQLQAIPVINAETQSKVEALTQRKTDLESEDTRLSKETKDLEAEYNQIYGQAIVVIEGYKNEKLNVRAIEIGKELVPIVKPTNLPQRVLKSMVDKIANNMTGLCQALGQQFVVSVNDELEFVITKPSGRVEIARRLSEGQQECVSFVFWVTRLLWGMGNGLPLMIFDEPSAHMEDNVVIQFGEMLKSLHPILVANNKQVIVITHDKYLMSCGGACIDMGA